ncbi:uncharacterized protein EI90DRAFT_844621 [Cantharellus anzutake]|uniref:uncharacterized protein n=1 Tax=Cantharellus anzutake TaxID=1750568 RepID=UPI001906D5E7|nr:uncharacterized protein EI90DRAFT_844621 [Cantharellus anzutake]KAF8332293.1 hypothetical protein EI90DRAFT_844621 [Cantharellus anzutake]
MSRRRRCRRLLTLVVASLNGGLRCHSMCSIKLDNAGRWYLSIEAGILPTVGTTAPVSNEMPVRGAPLLRVSLSHLGFPGFPSS